MIADLQQAKKGELENYFPELLKQVAIPLSYYLYMTEIVTENKIKTVYQHLDLAYICCNNLLIYFVQ